MPRASRENRTADSTGRPPLKGGYKWNGELTEMSQKLHEIVQEINGLLRNVDEDTYTVLRRWADTLHDIEAQARDLRMYADRD